VFDFDSLHEMADPSKTAKTVGGWIIVDGEVLIYVSLTVYFFVRE